MNEFEFLHTTNGNCYARSIETNNVWRRDIEPDGIAWTEIAPGTFAKRTQDLARQSIGVGETVDEAFRKRATATPKR
jgi:hypothetical protein